MNTTRIPEHKLRKYQSLVREVKDLRGKRRDRIMALVIAFEKHWGLPHFVNEEHESRVSNRRSGLI